MNEPPLPACLCPHGWRKFDQGQRNMMRFLLRRGSRKNDRRCRKWARVMRDWMDRIYKDFEEWNVTTLTSPAPAEPPDG